MGLFDSLHIKCPGCKHDLEFQSKSGECLMREYSKSNLPIDVAVGMNGNIARCSFCKKNYILNYNIPKKLNVKLIPTKKKADYNGN